MGVSRLVSLPHCDMGFNDPFLSPAAASIVAIVITYLYRYSACPVRLQTSCRVFGGPT